MISPRQAFEDNIRPADLLLRMYRLLECEAIQTDGELVNELRVTINAHADEELMLIYNEIFLGLVRERANMPVHALKRSALNNLLRQSIVAACTALDTYLPALLRSNLPTVIRARGRDFIPPERELQEYFRDLKFDLSDTLRLLGDPDAPLYIANKVLGFMAFKYLSSKKGIQTVGTLLTLDKPWDLIAARLQRDKKDLMKIIEETAQRRNDIVHRADRSSGDPDGNVQEISFSLSKQAVDTITHVTFALDELVLTSMAQIQTMTTA